MDTSQVIIAIIGSNVLFTFTQFLISRHDKKKEKQSDETKGMRDMILGLGHDKLLYVRLGGNGDCEVGYKTCEKLPTLTDDEAMQLDGRMKRREYGIEEREV